MARSLPAILFRVDCSCSYMASVYHVSASTCVVICFVQAGCWYGIVTLKSKADLAFRSYCLCCAVFGGAESYELILAGMGSKRDENE